MTSSVSCEFIFFHITLEDILITLNLKFSLNRLVTSRDIDVLVQNRRRFLNQNQTLKHANDICFWNQTVITITKICFRFQIVPKLKKFAKVCKICKFRSAILNLCRVAIFSNNYSATMRTKANIL